MVKAVVIFPLSLPRCTKDRVWRSTASVSWKTRDRRRRALSWALGLSRAREGPRRGRRAGLTEDAGGRSVRRLPSEAAPTATTHAGGTESFSQAGEDLSVNYIFQLLGITTITYLDVGANDPIDLSNTYFFYLKGHRGVLVEPNVDLCQKLREVRPRDETLPAGIGMTAAKEADYYLLTYRGSIRFRRNRPIAWPKRPKDASPSSR